MATTIRKKYHVGSSPRRRGTRARHDTRIHRDRFIPAQAGNTAASGRRSGRPSVHPRAGGEHNMIETYTVSADGSSPRRRGTHSARRQSPIVTRFIPAQAGNTIPTGKLGERRTVHPRAGGEHEHGTIRGFIATGSSPRRRGTRIDEPGREHHGRFIPAQAGNTIGAHCSSPALSVHPRAGGEHRYSSTQARLAAGSSPRRRGTPAPQLRPEIEIRFIPAQAGNTSGRASRAP